MHDNPISPTIPTAPLLRVCAIAILALFASAAFADDGHNHLPMKQHKDSDAPFLKPDEAVAKMAIPDGFEVSVFASEPDIAEPIAFCFDERGRMWVVENFNYQTRKQHTDEQVSRIQILDDTDGDGVFDKKKTFTDKLKFTSGIACGFGGVFVGSPPNLAFIPDADGDDVPDGPPEVLLDGWGINDRHETLNSFIWGPDGWLYGCHGVFTQSNVGKPGDDDSQRQFIDAGIWRYHPTRKTFEIFARGLSNPWGFDFNDHGQGFATCCVIPHLFHVVQGGVYHKQSKAHVNSYIYDDIKTIRDHTHLSAHGGARFYLADTFPKQYRDRLFMCNIHEHAVLTDIMEPSGSSFIGKHGDDFMPTNDLAWVGFSVETGPEGGVYILDWHDQDICGNAIKFPNSGRVYRIMPKGVKAEATPNLGAMSDAELVQLQMHSNDWYVRQARTLLQYRAATGELDRAFVHAKLNEMLGQAQKVPKRLRAMWALQVTGGLSRDRLADLLNHESEHVRAWAIQFLCDPSTINAFQPQRNAGWKLEAEVLRQFASMAQTDPSPIVRLYLASAVQRLPFAERWSILEGLVSHAEDVSDNNLPRMYWFALEPMVPRHPRQSLEVAVAGKIPALQEFVARRLVTGDSEPEEFSQVQQAAEWDRIIQTVAKGMSVTGVGEGGVVEHKVFRNQMAVQTHPLDRQTPCVLSTNRVDIPQGRKTSLKLRVSHHPHGDWQLRVLVDGKIIADQIVSAETVGPDEWLDLSVDLSKFAGRQITLSIENLANDWHNEWAYWNKIEIVTEVSLSAHAAPLKPRIVVLTDITTFEPDDHQSLTRLLAHADLYEIEGIVVSTSWGLKDMHDHLDSIDIAQSVIDAYENDLPNLLKRSNQTGSAQDSERQEIGYWPSAQYLRDRTMFGSMYRGTARLGAKNNSKGSDLIIKLADEDDDRPIWVTFWGGGNTLAQSIWKVQQTRSESELKTFLHKVRAYAIADQDRSNKTSFETSSHAWMRRTFSDDLLFIWEDSAWWYQVGFGRDCWSDYETHIQHHGNLGTQYPKFRFGVEGDTPSFLHIVPNGLNNPDVPTQVGWGGYSEWGLGEDKNGHSYVNRTGDAHTICRNYAKYFYPATFNNFAARMDWAKEGKGNRNPVAAINGDDSLDILTLNPKQRAAVKLDASKTTDPDGDALSCKWWVQPEAGSYAGTVEIKNRFSKQATVEIPIDSAGKTFHVICEVTDDGVPNLTAYRRIIFAPVP